MQISVLRVGLHATGGDAIPTRVVDNGDGTWNYEYAIYNLTSDLAANAFIVPVPAGVTVTDREFSDAPSHSGEPYKTFNWAPVIDSGIVGWKTTEHSIDPDANAVRWGTMYNFWFTADAPPVTGTAEMETFKDDGLVTVSVRVPEGSANPYDLNGDGNVNGADVGSVHHAVTVEVAFRTDCSEPT